MPYLIKADYKVLMAKDDIQYKNLLL